MSLPSEYLPSPEEALQPPVSRPLFDLAARNGDSDPDELLRHRYLCRGGGLLIPAPTGIGKSSFVIGAAIQWAMGEPYFGIAPVRPLRVVIIQAENDEGDLAEMRDGFLKGHNVPEWKLKEAKERVFVVHEDARSGEKFFAEVVEPILKKYMPDILIIDPALAYLGGDVSAQKDVGRFLRNWLNPLLKKYNCGCVLVHHTNKPPRGEEKGAWEGGDFAYLGSGSAEWANWARAVLAIRSLGAKGIFELRAGKRGSRIGWKEADGLTPAFSRLIGHSNVPGVIFWRDAEQSELPAKPGKRSYSAEDLLPHIPLIGYILKDGLQTKAGNAGISVRNYRQFVEELIDEGKIYLWTLPRANARPAIAYSRQPQRETSVWVANSVNNTSSGCS